MKEAKERVEDLDRLVDLELGLGGGFRILRNREGISKD